MSRSLGKLAITLFITLFFIPAGYSQRGCCSYHGGISGQCSDGQIVCRDGTRSPSCRCSSKSDRAEEDRPPLASSFLGKSRVSGFKCEGKRTCSEMTSCKEALFYLNECGVSSLDRDRDGVPCESIC